MILWQREHTSGEFYRYGEGIQEYLLSSQAQLILNSDIGLIFTDYLELQKSKIYIESTYLSQTEIRYINNKYSKNEIINVFDISNQPKTKIYQLLFWLQNQPIKYALMSNRFEVEYFINFQSDSFFNLGDIGQLEGVLFNIESFEIKPDFLSKEDDFISWSLVAKKDIQIGDVISASSISYCFCRQKGISPTLKNQIIGKVARYNIPKNSPITFGFLSIA